MNIKLIKESEHLICEIITILQKQQFITMQGINYTGKKDVALEAIRDLICKTIEERDKKLIEHIKQLEKFECLDLYSQPDDDLVFKKDVINLFNIN